MFKKKIKVNQSEVLKFGFLGGILQAGYIVMVVMLMNYMTTVRSGTPDSIADPIMALTLFVFSAAVSALLVFGYPAYLAMQKRYAESLMTAVTTLLSLAIIGILLFSFILFV